LKDLNDNKIKEGSYTYALLSTFDDLIGFGDIVWGRFTSEWPTMMKSKIYESKEWTHMHLRDNTKDV
jgi:triacylglycerol lipase